MAEAGPSLKPIFRFGTYELDLSKGELRKGGHSLHMQPQPLKVLQILVTRAGELVTREELKQQIWGEETFVDFERGLNFCIRQIRSVLNDDANMPRFIETMPKRGYRFVFPVTRIGGASTDLVSAAPITAQPMPSRATETALGLRWKWTVGAGLLALVVIGIATFAWFGREKAVPTQSARVRLAVLPFQNLTGDPQKEFASDGLTEEMIGQLGRMYPARLGVIARTSAMTFKNSNKTAGEIGRELNVDYIVEGSLRYDGDRGRVTAQLIEVKDQTHLWADNFDFDVQRGEMLEVQRRIAERIASSLSLQLLPATAERPVATTNRDAYDAYLRGRYYWNRRSPEGMRKAIENFEAAIKLDPKYAPAYAGLADAYNVRFEYEDTFASEDWREKARGLASRALELDDTLAEAHASLATVLWRRDWNWEGAEREFQRAIALNPNYATAHHWYGLFLASRRRFPEAQQQLTIALEEDPLSLIINTNLGWAHYWAREYDDAIGHYKRTLEMDPTFDSARIKLTWLFEAKGMWKEAFETRVARLNQYKDAEMVAIAQNAYKGGNYPAAIEAMLKESSKRKLPYFNADEEAKMWAAIGKRDRAIKKLQEQQHARSGWLVFANVEPLYDPLRTDPRFGTIASQVGPK